MAPTGQTISQGACSQCMQRIGLEKHLRLVRIAFVVAVDAQPMHLALMNDLRLADRRNVVFGLAGDDASIAADTGVQIDAHRPRCRPGRYPPIEMRLRLIAGKKTRVVAEAGKVAVPHEIAGHIEHKVVVVGAGKLHGALALLQGRRLGAVR